jgi:signal transduction histidine kinase
MIESSAARSRMARARELPGYREALCECATVLLERFGCESVWLKVRAPGGGTIGVEVPSSAEAEPASYQLSHELSDELGAALGAVVLRCRDAPSSEDAVRAELAELGWLISDFARRAELLGAVAQQNRRLTAAAEILATLSTAKDLGAACDAICEQLRRFFEAGHVALGTIDASARVRSVLGFSSDVMERGALPDALDAADIAAYEPAIRGAAQHFGELTGPLNPGTELIRAHGLRSLIRAPFALSDGRVGLVSVASHTAGRYAAPDAEQLLELCRPIGLAMDRVALIAEMARSRDVLEAQAKVLASLGPGATLEAVAQTYVHEVRRLFGASHAVVARFLPAGGEVLAFESEHLTREELVLPGPQDTEDAAVFDRIRHGQHQLITDMAQPGMGSLARQAAARGIRTMMRAPIRLSDGVAFGLVTLGSGKAFAYTPQDLERLDTLASALGLVAERTELQRQLMQSQKMESLGALAGNVAHEFNNFLTTILGHAGMLRLSGGLASDQQENVALIEDAARRAAGVAGRLLSFARGGLVSFGPVDLCNVLHETLRLAGPAFQGRVEVQVAAPAAPLVVDGDGGQLGQALLNIMLNARDAMPGGGTLSVALRGEDGQATLTIADTGPGIDEETRLRVFEPFFSTKGPGSGTGLGLAIAYGIVGAHGGTITVASSPGEGACFTITLPLAARTP